MSIKYLALLFAIICGIQFFVSIALGQKLIAVILLVATVVNTISYVKAEE